MGQPDRPDGDRPVIRSGTNSGPDTGSGSIDVPLRSPVPVRSAECSSVILDYV